MLAPYCEAEVSEPVISRLGLRSLDLWREHFPETPFNGSLVVAHPRDRADFERFARLTSGHRRLDAEAIARTRTVAGGPFSRRRCFIPTKAMSSRAACCRNCMRASPPPAAPSSSTATSNADDLDGIVIDCRGLAARDTAAGPARRQGRDDHRRDRRDRTVAPGAADPSALAALHHPARRPSVHDRRHLDRGRGHRRQRALGAGTAERGLCGASGVRRSAHRRIRLRPAAGVSRQSAAHRDRRATGSRSTDFIATASCWRRRWRN